MDDDGTQDCDCARHRVACCLLQCGERWRGRSFVGVVRTRRFDLDLHLT
jgi:hypothetical protein